MKDEVAAELDRQFLRGDSSQELGRSGKESIKSAAFRV